MSMSDFIQSQIDKGCEIIENNTGSMTMNNGEIVCSGSVTIRRGKKRVVLKGNSIVKKGGEWYVDGKKVDTSDVGMTESDIVNIEITGDVTNLHATSGDVTVNGSCISVSTGSGDVKCEGAVNVSTGSGDVTCSRIGGSVSTGTGNIYRCEPKARFMRARLLTLKTEDYDDNFRKGGHVEQQGKPQAYCGRSRTYCGCSRMSNKEQGGARMTRDEILEKVYAGSKFYVNFEKRSVRVDGKLVVENGDFGDDEYEKEGDFSLEGTLATIEDLYNEYLHSIPSERSESHRKSYFIALKEKDLDDEDMMYGEQREISRARLETYVLEAISRGWLYWDEEKMGSYFWQSKKHKSLIILRDWVEPKREG